MNWRTDELPDMLVSVRQFIRDKRWYEVHIWDGSPNTEPFQFIGTAKSERQAIKAATAAYRGGF